MKLEAVTVQKLLDNIVDTYEENYGKNPLAEGKLKKLNQLKNLTLESRTKENIDNIIGNPYWTAIECDFCGENISKAITIRGDYSDDPRYDICLNCLKEVIEELK